MSRCNEPPKPDLKKLVDRTSAEDLRELVEMILTNDTPYTDDELRLLEYFITWQPEHKSIKTSAGVYIEGIKSKHRRVNDLLIGRAAPGQEIPDKDVISIRTYKKWETPYGDEKELKKVGLQPKGDGAHFTHVNTVDAPVNHICESGHQLLIGNKNAARYQNMSLRSFERWKPEGEQVGQYTIYNITSLDWQRKKDGK